MDINFLEQQREQLRAGLEKITSDLNQAMQREQRQIGAIQILDVLIKAQKERDEKMPDGNVAGSGLDSNGVAPIQPEYNSPGTAIVEPEHIDSSPA